MHSIAYCLAIIDVSPSKNGIGWRAGGQLKSSTCISSRFYTLPYIHLFFPCPIPLPSVESEWGMEDRYKRSRKGTPGQRWEVSWGAYINLASPIRISYTYMYNVRISPSLSALSPLNIFCTVYLFFLPPPNPPPLDVHFLFHSPTHHYYLTRAYFNV